MSKMLGVPISDEVAARRELIEESGLNPKHKFKWIGTSHEITPGQEWVFYEVKLTQAEDEWGFHADDDGGHEFQFFWSNINDPLDQTWHDTFHKALEFYKTIKQHCMHKASQCFYPRSHHHQATRF